MAAVIVLYQFTTSADSALWMGYKDVPAAVDGLCHFYEQQLKLTRSAAGEVSYTVDNLFQFVESVYDICFLCLQDSAYIPHGREWIKKEVYECLRVQVGH